MIYSLKNKFLFIHVYKTGGTSVYKALQSYLNESEKRLNFLSNHLSYAHHTASHIKEKMDKYDPKLWGDIFKFAFVRNTWDWQVSIYCQLENHHVKGNTGWIESFDHYLELRLSKDERLYNRVLDNQKDCVCDNDGKLIIDYLGHTETMQKDLDNISTRIGKPKTTIGICNQSMVYRGKELVRRPHYTEYYNSKTKRLVADCFAEDIEYFKFSYGK